MRSNAKEYHDSETKALRIEFGKYLKEQRIKKGLSIRKLSTACRLSATYLSYLERGIHGPPSQEATQEIAEALEVNVDDMLRKAGYIPKDVQDAIRNGGAEYEQLVRDFGKSGKKEKSFLSLEFSREISLDEATSEEVYMGFKQLINEKMSQNEKMLYEKFKEAIELWKDDLDEQEHS